MKILSKLDNTGMIEEVADKRYVTDAEKLTWNSKADKTYVDSQDALKADKTYVDNKVKTDVPAGAKFTDTITTINGKTGAIKKEDILALGIPGDDGPVVDLGTFNDEEELITHVLMNQLPTGQYTFIMNNYPYFMLLKKESTYYTGTFHDSESIFAYFEVSIYGEIMELKQISLRDLDDGLDLKADKIYVDSRVQTDVPSGAKFTDTTYSEITTAEIDAGTASTLRTITARRLKYLLDKIVALFPTKTSELTNDSGFLTNVTKSDVGLSNVTNVKQMPISNGVLENYREKLVTLSGTYADISLYSGNVFSHSLTGNTTYSIYGAAWNVAHSFTLIIEQTATVRTLTFPSSVKWQGGEIPDMTIANKTYILTFMTIDGGDNWLGMFGGEF